MSYDVDVVVSHGDGYSTTVFDRNITYNLRPMLVAAGLLGSFYSLEGMTAAEAQPIVYGVWRELRTRPEHYAKFDSPNGWGRHKHLLPWIKDFYLALRLHPHGVIYVS